MTHFIGGHTLDAGGIDMAARRAGNAGMTALQVFSAIPKFYGDRTSVRPERVARFRAALDEAGIRPAQVLVHAAYVLNTASADEEKWARAAAGLAKELERSTALGVGAVCFHPGSAGKGSVEEATVRVAAAITRALEAVPDGDTRLLVENTAGAGATVGRTPEEIGAILAQVPDRLRARTGYGLDTCHLYSAGYDLRESPAALAGILDGFERITGDRPGFFHLNDSEGELGSNRDRHALLGEGRIGIEPFGWLLADARARDVPLVLETPQRDEAIAEDDASADAYDVRMMELLRGLVRGRDAA